MANLNEETVKINYIVPYLHRLGFNSSDLRFEEGVTVRIGKSSLPASKRTGRLDILVSRGGENLFIVEAKRKGELLTPDDRDQGLSYASLVRPIAPFVLLTNGDQFLLYSTLTKEEVSEEKIAPDSDFTVSLPANVVEEAISHFLGLSKENLLKFCRLQIESEMKELVGSRSEPQRKFIPEIFVGRDDFTAAVAQFRSSGFVLFPLIADAGSGKTCCLCDLARRGIDQEQPTLFYRGINLKGPILDAVASDFNWTFSEQLSEVGLIRRLDRVLGEQQLLIIIDGVDEWEYEFRRQDLLATARLLAAATQVKLIFSCKSIAWSQFSHARGQPTGISQYVSGESRGDAFILRQMSRKEFNDAVARYQEFYKLERGMEDLALEAARRDPFFMRILFEVSKSSGESKVLLSSVDLFEEYLHQALSRVKHPDQGLAVLTRIGHVLFVRGEERLNRVDVLGCLGGVFNHEVLDELIEYQMLEATSAVPRTHISFYFSLLRDYVIVFHSERWHEMGDEQFEHMLEDLTERTIHQEALAFFYRYASGEKRRLMDAAEMSRAAAVLENYNMVVATDFPEIKNRFVPYAHGPIGYVGTFSPRSGELGFCNFKVLSDDDERIVLLPVSLRRLYDSNLAILHGGQGIIGAPALSRGEDVRSWVLYTAIGHQLREIMKDGLLNETQEPLLAAEAVMATVCAMSLAYGGEPHPLYRKRSSSYLRASDLFPLSLGDVRGWLNYRLLYSHFTRERLDEKLASGEIPVEQHEDGSVSYSGDLEYQDMRLVEQRIEEALTLSDSEIRTLVWPIQDSRLRMLDQRVGAALNTLDSAGIDPILEEVFPERRELERLLRLGAGGAENVCLFLEKAISMAFDIFVSLVKFNFPTLWHQFPSMRWQPMTVVAAVRIEGRERAHWSGATIYLCEGTSSHNRFIVRPAASVTTEIRRDPRWKFEVCVEGERFVRHEMEGESGVWQRHLTLNRLFLSSTRYLGDAFGYSSGTRIPPILRTLVYDWICAELPFVFGELCKRYGTQPRARDWTFFRGAQ